jgi:hypothetical protein
MTGAAQPARRRDIPVLEMDRKINKTQTKERQ